MEDIPRSRHILLHHEDSRIRYLWKQRLSNDGFGAYDVPSLSDILSSLNNHNCPEIIVCGQSGMSADTALDMVRQIRDKSPQTAAIFVATNGSEELAVRAFRAGVTDYIRQALDLQDLTASVTRLLGLTDRTSVRPAPASHYVPDLTEMEKTLKRPFLGNSAVMQEARSRLLRAAASNSTVLITG